MTLDAASEWFALEDSDADGYVSRRELMHIAQHLGMTPQEADASVSSYYMTVDADGDDRLSFDGQLLGVLVGWFGATRGVMVISSAPPSEHLPPVLECGFESWLGLEFSGFSMWHFLMFVFCGFLWILRFPPLLQPIKQS